MAEIEPHAPENEANPERVSEKQYYDKLVEAFLEHSQKTEAGYEEEAGYLQIDTGQPELGVVQLDDYYNGVHRNPHPDIDQSIFNIQRVLPATDMESSRFQYLIMQVASLNTDSFATERMADAIKDHALHEYVVLTPVGEGYKVIDPESDETFQQAFAAVTAPSPAQ